MMKKKIGADFFAEFTNLCGFERKETKILYTKSKTVGNGYGTDLWLLDTEMEKSRKVLDDVEFGGNELSANLHTIYCLNKKG